MEKYCKIHYYTLSNNLQYLNTLFKESKYYYNYLLAWSLITIIDDFGNLLYPNKLKNIDTKNNLILASG